MGTAMLLRSFIFLITGLPLLAQGETLSPSQRVSKYAECEDEVCMLEFKSTDSMHLLQKKAEQRRAAATTPQADSSVKAAVNLPTSLVGNGHSSLGHPSLGLLKTKVTPHGFVNNPQILISGAWSIPVVVLGFVIANMFADSTGISYALGCVCLWGTSGYVFALSADFVGARVSPYNGLAYMAWMWAFVGVCMIGLHFVFSFTNPSYKEEWGQVKDMSGKVWAIYIFSSVFNCGGQAFAQMACASSLNASAPHYAIASCYVIIVAPFFMFYNNERMSGGQLCGLLTVIAGVVVEGFSGWGPLLLSGIAVGLWSVATICNRLGEMWMSGSVPCTGLLFRLGFMCIIGVITATICHTLLGVPLFSQDLLILSFYNAIAASGALFCLVRAFAAKECMTGVVTGLLPGQTVMMSLMGLLVMNWQPTWIEWLGMLMVLSGCSAMCIFTTPQLKEENKDNTPRSNPQKG